MKLWKRNAVVVVIVLFVGVAVYLNWSYTESANMNQNTSNQGKLLGEATLVNANSDSKDDKVTKEEDTTEQSDKKTSTGYFASARLNRQQARDSALEILQQAATDAMADQSIIDEANSSIQAMANNALSEAQIENLVIAKGYVDCVCYINDNSVSVVVAATETGLTNVDIARIAEIVMDETGISLDQIKIIETKP